MGDRCDLIFFSGFDTLLFPPSVWLSFRRLGFDLALTRFRDTIVENCSSFPFPLSAGRSVLSGVTLKNSGL